MHKCNRTICSLLILASSTQHNAFEADPSLLCALIFISASWHHSYLILSFITLYECTTDCMSIQLLKDLWVVSGLGWLLWVLLHVFRFCENSSFHFISQDCNCGDICLTSQEIINMSSREVEPFFIPTNNVEGFQLLCILVST